MNADLSYTRWKSDHQSILETFADKKLLVLFSGGKDSSAALDLIVNAADEFGFEVEAQAGAFPVHRYTAAEKGRISSYWDTQGVTIFWHDLEESDDLIRAAPNPCLLCQNVRKKVLNIYLTRSTKDWNRLVITISFSLWDIVSYSIEHVLAEIYSDQPPEYRQTANRRFRETAQRFYPLLKMDEGYAVFRPLIRFNNDEILSVIARKNIPILSTPCEFKDYRPKRLLQNYYEKMGMRFDYNRVFDFAVASLDLPDLSAYTSMGKGEYLRKYF